MEVQSLLDDLWAGEVKDYDFDILNRKITFQVTVIDGSEIHHELVFIQVSSFYFVNADGEKRFYFPEVEAGDYVELTSVHYLAEKLGEVSANVTSREWEPHKFPSAPNFCIEIWSSWLLIEAECVQVDGVSIDLKS